MTKYIYDISFLVPGMPFDGDTLEKQSLGGSETAGLSMARELAKLGHRVRMFCNCQPGTYDRVSYLPLQYWASYVTTTPHNISIVQRLPDQYANRTAADINILWCHDLALGRQKNNFRATMWNVDRVFVVSEFMKEQYKEVYDLDDWIMLATKNGIDINKFPLTNPSMRNRKRLIYSARPERGMDLLLERIFPAILAKEPDAELVMFGYENKVDHLRDFYNDLTQKAEAFKGKVRVAGCLPKSKLYNEYAQGGVYVYPTPSPRFPDFREVSCISVMESMAAGMPVVTSAKGALVETLAPGAGVLVDGDPSSDEYLTKFVDATVRYMNDDVVYNKASTAGRAAAQYKSWAAVAQEWSAYFDKMYTEYSSNKTRLAYHFYRHNDIYSADEALKDEKTPSALRLKERIEKEYTFTAAPELLTQHYHAGGIKTDERLKEIPIKNHDFTESNEVRFHRIVEELENKPAANNILDYGCGHGWSTIYLHNKLPGRTWTGVDIDPNAVKWCNKFAKFHAKDPKALDFVVGDDGTVANSNAHGPYNGLIVSEVLEHTTDPYSTMENVEKAVSKGSLVIVTVPYGPSEYGTPNWETFRNHLWEFSLHDLYDMFGRKPNLSVAATSIYPNAVIGETIGFYMLTYEADHEPLGRIDMKRKMFIQRPRQTLGTLLIAGKNSEDTLRWCLNSIKWVCDEITIGDTGMSNEAKAIAADYNVILVDAPNPLEHGFDTARNAVLDTITTDWVLWIDTDEKLLGGDMFTKYLRESLWDGLSIRQHHFAIDCTFTPDMPVRVFRHPRNDGRKLKFIGHLHEHPEVEMNEGPGQVLVLPEVHIAHVGYLSERIRRERFIRNRPMLLIDEQRHPNRLLQKHFLMRDNCLLNMYELQQNGNVITEDIRERAHEVAELYRKHFLGKMKYANIDSLQYYTEALRVLGEGVDVVFSVGAQREGHGDAEPTMIEARFASVEEAQAELGRRLKERVDPLVTNQW